MKQIIQAARERLLNFLSEKDNIESQILYKLPVEIGILDTNASYIFINQNYIDDQELAAKTIGQGDEFLYRSFKLDKESLRKRKELFQKVLETKETVRFTEKLEFTDSDKTLYYKRFYIPFLDSHDNITKVCFWGNNITAIIHAQKELKYLAYHDKVTGLKNRSAFYDQLHQMIIEQDRQKNMSFSAVIYCDLDNFKTVNDTLGHDAGDFVLQTAAQRMQSCLRLADQVFRLGGDEFAILIKNIDNGFEAGMVAEKVIKSLSAPLTIKNQLVDYLTVSAGIALYPKDAIHTEELVRAADSAMYKAKSKGKNNFQFASEDVMESTLEQLHIEKNMRSMINTNDFENQLKVYYQPIIERTEKGVLKLIGLEALMRWENKELGFMRPDIFIKVAERMNAINHLGEWILFKAASDFKYLKRQNDNLKYISVNISPQQLISNDVYDLAKKLTHMSFVKPGEIQFEITESMYLDNKNGEIEKLESLRDLGFKLAIDDFGTGYASLAYLQKIPATTIKIDRSFISTYQQNSANERLTRSIISLAQNMDKDIIAEGVEKLEQLNFLAEQQCNNYQGFLFCRPTPIEKLSKFTEKDLKNIVDNLSGNGNGNGKKKKAIEVVGG